MKDNSCSFNKSSKKLNKVLNIILETSFFLLKSSKDVIKMEMEYKKAREGSK